MRQYDWRSVNNNERRWFCMNGIEGHPLSIATTKSGYYLMDDPSGNCPFYKKNALAGPFPDLESAKVAYIIRMEAGR